MKYHQFLIFAICLLLSFSSASQHIINMKDGSIIARTEDLKMSTRKKIVVYKDSVGVEHTVKMKDIESIKDGHQVYKTTTGGKWPGYYIMAESNGYRLASTGWIGVVSTRDEPGHRTRGEADLTGRTNGPKRELTTTFGHRNVVLLNSNSEVVAEFDIEEDRKNRDRKHRIEAADMVKQYFSECPVIMERLAQYDDPTDKYRVGIFYFFEHYFFACNE